VSTLNTKLDANQVIRQTYDEAKQRLRVDAQVSASISDIEIKDPDGDTLQINPDGSTNVNILNDLNIEVRAESGDSIIITDGDANPYTSSQVGTHTLLHSQTPDTSAPATPLNTLNSNVAISVEGLSSVGFQLNSGTFTGILVAESSVDGGNKWTTVPFYDPINSSVLTQLIFTSPNPDKIVSIIPIGGSSHVRVRVLSYTSGSATGLLRATQVSGSTGTVTASAFGNVVNTYPVILANIVTQILAPNVNRKYSYISNNSASTLRLQFNSGVGLAANTGFALEPQEVFELKGDNLYTGAVYALSASDVTLSIAEGSP